MPPTPISPQAIAAHPDLGDWRFSLDALHAEFVLDTFPAGAALLAAIAEAAETTQHHPELHLRYPGVVRVDMSTHEVDGVTDRDVDLARAISQLAAEAGASARPTVVQSVELTIDTMDADRIRPFWRAVLGYGGDPDAPVTDSAGFGPPILFQPMDEPRRQRNRIHVDISVPHDVAEQRVEAALAAGGRLVSDAHARAWWVLADADGNEACVCTWQDR